MLINMKNFANEVHVSQVVETIKRLGFTSHIHEGEVRKVVAVVGEGTGKLDTQVFEMLDGVEEVVRIQKPYKLASRDFRKANTIMKIGNFQIGGKKQIIMAGPCSVESEDQISQCAKFAAECGAGILRGGAFKPRTSPFAFQGLRLEGLKLLRKAADESGLLVVTEVVSPETVGMVSTYADILQIGARNMQNYPLLDKVGQSKKPVLLKRGLSATIPEWLQAADYVLQYNENGESPNVILCLRGIRTFDTATRFTYDIGILPVLRELTHLPIIVDPSHPAGNYRYVPDLAKMAIVGGADGLIVEIHPNPQKALSDGAQSLNFGNFAVMMQELGVLSEIIGRRM